MCACAFIDYEEHVLFKLHFTRTVAWPHFLESKRLRRSTYIIEDLFIANAGKQVGNE